MNVTQKKLEVINPGLKDYINDYYVFEFESELPNNFTFKVPPTGFPTMLFCFGNKMNFFQHKHLTNESIIVGQLSKHINLHPVTGTKIFGVNFKPYGFYNLFNKSLKDLKNSAIESSVIFDGESITFIEELLTKNCPINDVIYSIESLLLFHKKEAVKNDFFDGIVDEIVKMNGLADPFQMATKNASIRSFQRYFNEVIGINPKVFCQVLRHKFILQLLYMNPDLKWNELILGGYYYDYSHFQKDFLKFTDVKPIDYLPYINPFAQKLL